MSMEEKFLEKAEVEVLVQYFKDQLSNKINKGEVEQVELPNDLVRTDDLNIYAKKNEIISELPDNLVYNNDLAAYATLNTLNNYASNADVEALRSLVQGVYHFKGSVNNLAALQAIENPEVGDVYNLADTGMNAAWTGTEWDDFGSIVDLAGYLREEDIQTISRQELNEILYNGSSAIVSNVESINAMIANDEPEVEIKLNKNLSGLSTITIPEGKKVTVDLGGNNIVSTGTTFYANGGELVLKNGSLTSNSNPAVIAQNGATVTVDGANIISAHHNGINATEAEVIINSGSITSQEAGIAGFKDSVITINGGTITGIDNGGLMGNGSPAGSDNDGSNMNVIMNGGKIIGHIQSAGYVACGVYVPNTGSFIMNGGEIESDGCGICMRGGLVKIGANAKITATGTSGVKGKVGDSRVVVGPYAIVYDANSKYPGMDSLELIIENGAQLSGTDGDIDTILAEGQVANITDNR